MPNRKPKPFAGLNPNLPLTDKMLKEHSLRLQSFAKQKGKALRYFGLTSEDFIQEVWRRIITYETNNPSGNPTQANRWLERVMQNTLNSLIRQRRRASNWESLDGMRDFGDPHRERVKRTHLRGALHEDIAHSDPRTIPTPRVNEWTEEELERILKGIHPKRMLGLRMMAEGKSFRDTRKALGMGASKASSFNRETIDMIRRVLGEGPLKIKKGSQVFPRHPSMSRGKPTRSKRRGR